jgi:hypothetical protein
MTSSVQTYQSTEPHTAVDLYRIQGVATSQSNPAKQEQSSHRRHGSNAIAPYLQIPPSINDSKGSLAEFAAQV